MLKKQTIQKCNHIYRLKYSKIEIDSTKQQQTIKCQYTAQYSGNMWS